MAQDLDKNEQQEIYSPTPREQKYQSMVWADLLLDWNVKNQEYDVLNGRTITQFWEDGNYDYNNVVFQDNSVVNQYSSGILRDKSNTFITNLAIQLLIPTVIAQNPLQQIDNIVSRVGRSILEWQITNDGRPAESGILKNVRGIHKQVVEGTQHTQDDVDENGRLISTIVPNEEIFVPNFFQPNIQLQSRLSRVQFNVPFEEAKVEFGDHKKWKFVGKGASHQLGNEDEEFKKKYKSIMSGDGVTIIRRWTPVPQKELRALKAIGKLPFFIKKAKYFNIMLNNVVLFDVDHIMPYWHGDYPMTKGVFEWFSPVEFYWGNSMPNKGRQDKQWLDGWKTLIRYKGKLAAIPPLLNYTGQHMDDDIVVPGLTTDMPAKSSKDQLVTVPGISNGISNGDIALMKDATEDIDRATSAPQASGQQTGGRQTARETIIIEQNAQKALRGFAQQVAFVQEARVNPILKSSFQFLPRHFFSKISIPGQIFDQGKEGILEVMFEDTSMLVPMNDKDEKNGILSIKKQKEARAFELMEFEEKEEKETGEFKRQILIDPEYAINLDFYGKAGADSLEVQTRALREAKAEFKFSIYSTRPDLFNVKQAARNLVRELGDNEQEMIIDNPVTQPNPAASPPPTNEKIKEKSKELATSELGI